MQKLVDILEKDALSLSWTTDMWTSIANEAYLTVFAHYISSEWKLQSYVLATSAFPERHTAAEIAHKLVDITDDYKITSKVLHVVHDQGANMVAAIEILEVDKGWTSLRCTAHCLQLCINAGLSADSKIERMVAAAKKLMGHFKHSVLPIIHGLDCVSPTIP